MRAFRHQRRVSMPLAFSIGGDSRGPTLFVKKSRRSGRVRPRFSSWNVVNGTVRRAVVRTRATLITRRCYAVCLVRVPRLLRTPDRSRPRRKKKKNKRALQTHVESARSSWSSRCRLVRPGYLVERHSFSRFPLFRSAATANRTTTLPRGPWAPLEEIADLARPSFINARAWISGPLSLFLSP